MNMPWALALSDGRAGNARQAWALARALAGEGLTEERSFAPPTPWRWLAPRALPGARAVLHPRVQPAPSTRVLVGCGRQAALATRVLRSAQLPVVQILDPRIDPRHWDVVVVPAHDPLRGENVFTLTGSLNPVDDAWLARARAGHPPPAPHVVTVLVGGPTRHVPMRDAAFFTHLHAVVDEAAAHGEHLLITTSRRTPPHWVAALPGLLAHCPHTLWRSQADGPNPYATWLAWATRIVVTPDSVNMVSEACATHVPVQVLPGEVTGRIAHFLDDLRARGRLTSWGAPVPAAITPVRDTARIAAAIRSRLQLPPPG